MIEQWSGDSAGRGLGGTDRMRNAFQIAAVCIVVLATTAAIAEPALQTTANKTEPSWRLLDLAGRNVALEDYQSDLLIIDFWATWCVPCVVQAPLLNKFYENLNPRVTLLGVAVNDDRKAVSKFIDKHKRNYTIVLGGEAIAKYHGVVVYPTIVIRTPDGSSEIGHVGVVDIDNLRRMIEAALPPLTND